MNVFSKCSILNLVGFCMAMIWSVCAYSGTDSKFQCVAPQSTLTQVSGMPTCPSSSSLFSGIDNTFPTGAVFVNLRIGDVATYDFIEAIYDFIREQKSIAAKLNLVVDHRYTDDINKYADKKLLSIVQDKKRVNIIPIEYDSSGITWPQDWLQFVYAEGKPAFFRVTYQGDNYKPTPNATVNRDLNPGIQVARSCGIPTVNHKIFGQDNETGWDATMSGNFEVIKSNVWVTGTSDTVKRILNDPSSSAKNLVQTFYSQVETLREKSQIVLELDAQDTPVSHVDELINVIKVQDSKCGFAILSASPDLALEIIKKQKNDLSQDQAQTACSNTADNSWPEADTRIQEQLKIIQKFGCLGFSRKTAKHFVEDKKLVEMNNRLQTRMSKNEQILVQLLKLKNVCKDPKVIRLPVLIQKDEKWSGNANPVSNLVNGLVLTPVYGSSTYLYPKTNYPPFEEYITKVMAKQAPGVKLRPIWGETYLSIKGGFHCATSTIQVCR